MACSAANLYVSLICHHGILPLNNLFLSGVLSPPHDGSVHPNHACPSLRASPAPSPHARAMSTSPRACADGERAFLPRARAASVAVPGSSDGGCFGLTMGLGGSPRRPRGWGGWIRRDASGVEKGTGEGAGDSLGGEGEKEREGEREKAGRVVSLLLRRKSSKRRSRRRGEDYGESRGEGEDEVKEKKVEAAGEKRVFRRVQSQLHPPVAGCGGEGRRYFEYAAELDDDSFERLRRYVKGRSTPASSSDFSGVKVVQGIESADGLEAAMARVSFDSGRARDSFSNAARPPVAPVLAVAPVGSAMRLEDYADGSSDDQFSMEEEEEDVGRGVGGDEVTWVGNEAEFAAFIADFGLDDALFDDEPGPDVYGDFDVGEDVFEQWREDIVRHNAQCGDGEPEGALLSDRGADIRQFTDDFLLRRRSRSVEEED